MLIFIRKQLFSIVYEHICLQYHNLQRDGNSLNFNNIFHYRENLKHNIGDELLYARVQGLNFYRFERIWIKSFQTKVQGL